MGVLEIKGVRIGEGRPKTIVSLMDQTVEALLDKAHQAVQAGADLLEWRADFYPEVDDTNTLVATCRTLMDALPQTPLIFTLRTAGQGGEVEPDALDYQAVLTTIIENAAPDLVDIELGIGDDDVRTLVEEAHEYDVCALVSQHDFASTPDENEMVETLAHMASLGADICKLAVMPTSAEDPRRLMRATARAHEQLEEPLLTMSMGETGRHTRFSGEVFGSALTFCSYGRASAPGQVDLAEAIATLDALHRQQAGE